MPRKKKPEHDLPDGIYPNKYRKKCADPSCGVMVEPGEGFIERVDDGAVTWRTWCKDHVPKEPRVPAQHGRDRESDEYYDKMIVVTQRGQPIDAAEIERCANELGIARFPRGYPELMTRFGAGEFNHFLRIRTPAEIVEWRTQFANFRALDIGDSCNGDRFSFKPTKPDWLFVILRHHPAGICGAGWGMAKMLEWLVSDNEVNESGFMTEVYYRPYSEETGMVRLRQTRQPPSGEDLDKALAQVLEPNHTIRRFTEQRDQLELFYPAFGGHIEYSTTPEHTQLFIWLDCVHAREFLGMVLPALALQGFDETIHTVNLPTGIVPSS